MLKRNQTERRNIRKVKVKRKRIKSKERENIKKEKD